jgi:hypothetical protein
MSTKASSEDSSIEYSKRFLPPLWVDIQEEIEKHIEDITTKSKHIVLFDFAFLLCIDSEWTEEVTVKENKSQFRRWGWWW